MINVSKAGWALLAFIAGALLGSSMPNEIQDLKSNIRSSVSTLATTAGRGSQELGEIAAE